MRDKRYSSSIEKPRHPNFGGWRGAPASLAALATHRKPWAGRRCKCGLIAMTGSKNCFRHTYGGARNVTPARAARRELARAFAHGLVPEGLLRVEVFARTNNGRMVLAPFALALLRAWDNRANDPLGWVEAVRAARGALEA